MGYTLMIGQAMVEWDDDRVCIEVEDVTHDLAPAFGEPTDFTNARWSGYSEWADFCRELGLMDLFFGNSEGWLETAYSLDESGQEISTLMPEHPGVKPLLPKHVQIVERKAAEYKGRQNAIAKFPDEKTPDPDHDDNLCRAEWLIYWMRWAVNNCDKPVFYNS